MLDMHLPPTGHEPSHCKVFCSASLHLHVMQHFTPRRRCLQEQTLHPTTGIKSLSSCLFGVLARLQFAMSLFRMAFACAMSRRGYAYFSTPGMPNVLPYILVQQLSV